MERNRQKLVGWDKGSLTEQQVKRTVTTKIQMRRIQKTKQNAESNSHCPHPLRTPKPQLPSRPPAPLSQNPA